MKVFIASAANKEIDKNFIDLAYNVSEIFAKRNFDLLFGAANYSMMGACYKAFVKYKRKIYAYTVPKYERDFKKLPKAKCVKVNDTLLRFRKLYFRSDYMVILPGGIGTLAELTSAIEEYRASFGEKKIIIINYNGFYDDIIEWLKKNKKTGFVSQSLFDCFRVVKDSNELEKILEKDGI